MAYLPFCTVHSISRIDEKNQAIEQLQDQLHQRGGRRPAAAAVAAGETDGHGAGGRGGGIIREYLERNGSNGSNEGAGTRGDDAKKMVRGATRCNQPWTFSSGKGGQRAMLATLSGLRSDLQGMNTQVKLMSKTCDSVTPILPHRWST